MSVLGNLLGLSGHEYPTRTIVVGGLTFTLADELVIREEFKRRITPERAADMRRHGNDPDRANGFVYREDLHIWCKWNAAGTHAHEETMGHEINHLLFPGYEE